MNHWEGQDLKKEEKGGTGKLGQHALEDGPYSSAILIFSPGFRRGKKDFELRTLHRGPVDVDIGQGTMKPLKINILFTTSSIVRKYDTHTQSITYTLTLIHQYSPQNTYVFRLTYCERSSNGQCHLSGAPEQRPIALLHKEPFSSCFPHPPSQCAHSINSTFTFNYSLNNTFN